MRRLGAVTLAAVLSACIGVIDPFDPEVGEPLAARCEDADSDPDTDVSFTKDVLPIIAGQNGSPGCGCHFPTSATPIGFEQTGLDLSSLEAARAGGTRSRGVTIVPGKPCSSIFVLKIGPAPPVGARMPFNGPPYLSDENIRIISDWIAEGALAN